MERIKKWLSVFVVIISVLSGMCFEWNKTDLSFAYPKEQESACTLSAPVYDLCDSDRCREEQLGVRTAAGSIEAASKSTVRYGIKARFFLSALDILPENFKFLLEKASANVYREATFSRMTIISYIHHQDGAKA